MSVATPFPSDFKSHGAQSEQGAAEDKGSGGEEVAGQSRPSVREGAEACPADQSVKARGYAAGVDGLV